MNEKLILVMEEPRGPSQLVEVPVTIAGSQKVQLPDVQQLRSYINQDIVVKAIRLISAKVLANAPIGGQANATLAELRKISLVIYCEGWEKAQLIPILSLNDMADADSANATTIPYRNRTTRFDDWRNVDWSKSFLQYSNGSGGAAGVPYAVILEVEYQKFNPQGIPIVGPS
jgi:hypothetical protein